MPIALPFKLSDLNLDGDSVYNEKVSAFMVLGQRIAPLDKRSLSSSGVLEDPSILLDEVVPNQIINVRAVNPFTQISFPPFDFSPTPATTLAQAQAQTPAATITPIQAATLTSSPINLIPTTLAEVDLASLASGFASTSASAIVTSLASNIAGQSSLLPQDSLINTSSSTPTLSLNPLITSSSPTTTSSVAVDLIPVVTSNPTSTSAALANQSTSLAQFISHSPLSIGITSLIAIILAVFLFIITFCFIRGCRRRKERKRLEGALLRNSSDSGTPYVDAWDRDRQEESEKLDDLDIRWERNSSESYDKVEPKWNDSSNTNEDQWNRVGKQVVGDYNQVSQSRGSHNLYTPPTNKFLKSPAQPSYNQQPVRPIRPNQIDAKISPLTAYLEHQVPPVTIFHDVDLGNPSALGSHSNTSLSSTSSATNTTPTENLPVWRTSLDRVLAAAGGFVVGKVSLSSVSEERHLAEQEEEEFEQPKSPSLHKIPSLPIIAPSANNRIHSRIPVSRILHPDLSPELSRSYSDASRTDSSPPISPRSSVQVAHRVTVNHPDMHRASLIDEPAKWMSPEIGVAYSEGDPNDMNYRKYTPTRPSSRPLQAPSRHGSTHSSVFRDDSGSLSNHPPLLPTTSQIIPPLPTTYTSFSPFLTFPPALGEGGATSTSMRTVGSVSSFASSSWDVQSKPRGARSLMSPHGSVVFDRGMREIIRKEVGGEEDEEKALRMKLELERSTKLLEKTRKLAQARRAKSEGNALGSNSKRY